MSQSSSSGVRISSPGAAVSPGGESIPAPTTPQPPSDDRTVISDRPPLAPATDGSRPISPFEIGKLVAGDRLNHFELLEYVGGGGMGAVFRARDTMLDREVALKILSRAQGADDETRRRFHVEAQSAARLDHQNIARVYYVGEDQGLNFIVFEFIRGENIRDLVERQGALSVDDAVSFTLQIGEALAHACHRNVVHRDIKPSNIIVTAEGRAKLVDMGLARLHARTANDDLTASGVTLGTFDYISPEQARDPRMADVRSDIYSLGCTLYYMLTARPPFPEGTVLQKLLQHQADEVPDPRQINPGIPDEIATPLRRMLAKDPRQRFQEPGELIAELMVVADQLDLRPMTTGQFWIAPQQGLAFWERHLPWIAPVAALVLIVLGVEWFGSSSAPPGLMNPEDPRVAIARATPPPNVLPAENPKARVPTTPGARPRDNAPATRDDSTVDTPVGETPSTADVAKAGSARAVAANEDDEPPATERSTSRTARAGDSSGRSRDNVARNADSASTAPAIPKTSGDRSTGRLEQPDDPVDASRTVEKQARTSDSLATDARVAERPMQDAPLQVNEQEPRNSNTATSTGGVAILSVEGGERRQFASLKAACSAAKNNDVIELQFNGDREQEPLELANLRLTIRAGAGFRPVLAFRPALSGPAGFGRSMITITGGRLTFLNVGLLLDVAREATAGGWSLFETRQAEQLRFEGCSLTIRNPSAAGSGYHDNVAFFEIKAAPGLDTMMKTPESPQVHPVNLDLQNCIARGESTFIHSADAQALALDWDNGLLAVTGSLLLAEGSSSAAPAGERVEIRLNHLTAIARAGFIRLLAASDVPYLLKTEVTCANSFLVTQEAPLVEQRGPQRTSMLEQQFQWSGDRNFCQGFSVFWKLVDTNAANAPRLVSMAQWQSQMGQGDNLLLPNERLWKRAGGEDRPVSAWRREDFALADRLRGPGGNFEASDTGDVGMDPRRLPDLSADPSPLLRPRDEQRSTPGVSGER